MWSLLEEWTRDREATKKFRVDTCPIRPSFKVIAIFPFRWSATVYLRTKCSHPRPVSKLAAGVLKNFAISNKETMSDGNTDSYEPFSSLLE